ncbi:hypothetical protein JTB14_009284 [Gonioctena quinquepunctata]|nr:hypothetical protein JTB14_009284 [Gonioctena quinquepunctata]
MGGDKEEMLWLGNRGCAQGLSSIYKPAGSILMVSVVSRKSTMKLAALDGITGVDGIMAVDGIIGVDGIMAAGPLVTDLDTEEDTRVDTEMDGDIVDQMGVMVDMDTQVVLGVVGILGIDKDGTMEDGDED